MRRPLTELQPGPPIVPIAQSSAPASAMSNVDPAAFLTDGYAISRSLDALSSFHNAQNAASQSSSLDEVNRSFGLCVSSSAAGCRPAGRDHGVFQRRSTSVRRPASMPRSANEHPSIMTRCEVMWKRG